MSSKVTFPMQLEQAPVELPFWVISDTHFFHRNIISYAGRPDNHQSLMLKAWAEKIGENQTVLHLGDLAMNRPEKIEKLAPSLSGDKFLLKGNHDKRSRSFYANIGFKLINRPFVIPYRGWKILFSHYPDQEHSYLDQNTLNVHGHIHQKSLNDRRFINVSVEWTGYSPVWITDLLDERIAELQSLRSS